MQNVIELADYRDITPAEDAINMPEDGFVRKGLSLCGDEAAADALIAAHKWFSLAAMRGHQKARGHRLWVSERLTGEQIAAAQQDLHQFVSACS